LLCRLVTLSGQLPSADCAATALHTIARVQISGRHVQRLTQEVGTDLARLRDAQAAQQRRRQLRPRVAAAPAVAVVEVDGGRMGTRAPGVGPGVQQPQPKENKIAFLLSLRSETHTEDPLPQPPAVFRDHPRVAQIVQQIKSWSTPCAAASATPVAAAPDTAAPDTAVPDTAVAPIPAAADPAATAPCIAESLAPAPAADTGAAPATAAATVAEPERTQPRPKPPERLLRTCVASMYTSAAFGPLLAAEAQARNFFQALRQAFVGDGQQYNWTLQRAYFPHFEPIADFLHVLCYLYLAAWAVQSQQEARWQQYVNWMTACWQGRVSEVVAELAAWQEQFGRPPPDAAAHEPRQLVKEALTYLSHNAPRMDYPRYRRQGLPVTSSWVESLVGEFNARVKGWDKWWNRGQGAEAILQVRAAVLSEDDRLRRYFAERPGNPYRRHRNQK
jgi:hypothetical protein